MLLKKMIIKLVVLLLVPAIKSGELLGVVEVNRHGARTPQNFPELSEKLFFGSKDMSLTINGFRQEQILGKYVKQKYIKDYPLISKVYKKDEFQIISSPTQRTIFSAAGFLSGLYPDYTMKMNYDGHNNMLSETPLPLSISKEHLKEIPLEVCDVSKDSLFFALDCNFKGKNIKRLLRQSEISIFTFREDQLSNAIKELEVFLRIPSATHITGNDLLKSKNIENELKNLVKYYFPYVNHFKSQLKTLSDESWKTIKRLVLNDWYSFRLKENKLMKMTTSAFFEKLKIFISDLIDKNKQPHLKYQVISGHDTLLVNIISNILEKDFLVKKILNAVEDDSDFNFVVPPFASNLFFEFHKEDDLKVKVIYDGWNITPNIIYNTEKNPLMNLETFMKLLDTLIEEEYKLINCSKRKI
jgi:hypothetical protein